MKISKLNYILVIFLFINSTLIQLLADPGWLVKNSATNFALLHTYYSKNSSQAWACGLNGTIIHSTDRGFNWVAQQSGTTLPLLSIFFPNQNTGYTSGFFGTVEKTTNGGLTWQPVNIPTVQYISSVKFIDASSGYACGSYGIFFSTSNGGTSWSQYSDGTTYDLRDIAYANSLTNIIYCCGLHGTIIKSTNSGVNWLTLNSGTTKDLYSIKFADASTGIAVGDSGTILKTTNGGVNWNPKPADDNWNLFDAVLFFGCGVTSTSINGRMSSIGLIINSTDLGETWHVQETPTTKALFSIDFSDPNNGICVGDSGVVLVTTNGGNPLGIKPVSNLIPDKFILYQNYPNPFNPTTKIKFSVPLSSSTEEQEVQLVIYDILGIQIASLIPPVWEGRQGFSPGTYEVEWDAENYPSGAYFYKLSGPGFIQTRKMIMIK